MTALLQPGWAEHRLQGTDKIERIIDAVSTAFGFTREMLLQKPDINRKRIIRARMVAMALARETTNWSYRRIALKFGLSDHTTVIHACHRIRAISSSDERLGAVLTDLRKQIGEAA